MAVDDDDGDGDDDDDNDDAPAAPRGPSGLGRGLRGKQAQSLQQRENHRPFKPNHNKVPLHILPLLHPRQVGVLILGASFRASRNQRPLCENGDRHLFTPLTSEYKAQYGVRFARNIP